MKKTRHIAEIGGGKRANPGSNRESSLTGS
jgi:hypothetical protein